MAAKFEESALNLALSADDKDAEAIKSALGSATVDFSLRSATGRSLIHVAAVNCTYIRHFYYNRLVARQKHSCALVGGGKQHQVSLVDRISITFSHKGLGFGLGAGVLG